MDWKNRCFLRDLMGVFLLAALLTAGLLASRYMEKQTDALSGTLADSSLLALDGAWEEARSAAAGAREQWSRCRTYCAVFGDHRPMEEIEALFSELTVYDSVGDREEFARICSILSRRLALFGKGHSLTWENLF